MARILAILLLCLSACTPTAPPASDFAPLAELIEYHLADKDIPAISIALVDGEEVVYAHDFGKAPEGAVYRVGSVSNTTACSTDGCSSSSSSCHVYCSS